MKIKELKEKTEKFENNKSMISNIEEALKDFAREPDSRAHVLFPQRIAFTLIGCSTDSVLLSGKVTELVKDDLRKMLKEHLRTLINEQDTMYI